MPHIFPRECVACILTVLGLSERMNELPPTPVIDFKLLKPVEEYKPSDYDFDFRNYAKRGRNERRPFYANVPKYKKRANRR